jgi:ABC-type phosphate transport system substrate-binding protein
MTNIFNHILILLYHARYNESLFMSSYLSRPRCYLLLILGVLAMIMVGGWYWYGRTGAVAVVASDQFDLAANSPAQLTARLEQLSYPQQFKLYTNFPRLAGSSDTYPFYAALAQATYETTTPEIYVQLSEAETALESLLNGTSEMVFLSGFQVLSGLSSAQLAQLQVTVFGKDGLVFVQDANAPLQAITVDREGKLERWPQGVTVYSWHYFQTHLATSAKWRLLNLNDVAPIKANFANETYPLINDLLLVTRRDGNVYVQQLREFILSPQGQQLLVASGYLGK